MTPYELLKSWHGYQSRLRHHVRPFALLSFYVSAMVSKDTRFEMFLHAFESLVGLPEEEEEN